uniref:Chemokine interleukin-8-like domain-containing protein n=1 Tax=Pseudonaja textilis TaxID=8673 RepID=A0A670Z123_PSETE
LLLYETSACYCLLATVLDTVSTEQKDCLLGELISCAYSVLSSRERYREFITKKDRRICADPSEQWVQDRMKYLSEI